MVLVSFKNLNIWPRYGQKKAHVPIFGLTFFGNNSAISGPVGMNFLWEIRKPLSIDW